MTDDTTDGNRGDPPEAASSTPPHLTVDELADLAADAADDEAAARGREHLDTCAQCRAAAGELAEVSALLSSLPVPAIPAAVSTRIDAVLREAAAARVAAKSADARTPAVGYPRTVRAGGASHAVTSLDAARDRRSTGARARRAAAAAVGVAAVLGGGILFVRVVDLPSGGSDDSASSDSSYSASDSAGSAAAPSAPAGRAAGSEVTSSGTAYTAGDLVPDVQRLVARAGAPALASSPTDRQHAEDAVGGVATCVDAVTDRARSTALPLAVDLGSYDGQPAVVIVLPADRDSSAAGDIWVVSSDCIDDAGALDVLTHRALPTGRGS